MRSIFFKYLYDAMERDPRIVFLTGDLGFNLVEPIKKSFPDRFFNMQAAEFSMTGAAIGLVYADKVPVIYSITPFVVFRNMELLRTYVNHETIPIKIVGAGRAQDYRTEGMSHHAHDVPFFLNQLPRIKTFWPEDQQQLNTVFRPFIQETHPAFLNLIK